MSTSTTTPITSVTDATSPGSGPATTTATTRVTTDDGRTLAVDLVGPVDGPVVLFLHAAPGSRRFDPDPAATTAAGIRLVTVDRAGYGGSTPLADEVVPTIGHHVTDAVRVVEALGLGPVAVVGWSAGGRVAAGLAAARPDLVRSLAVVATPAPDDEVPWVEPEHRAMSAELRADPATAVAQLGAAFAPMADAIAGDPGVARSMVAGGPADEALLAADPDLAERVAASVRAGVAPGIDGMVADIVADQVSPWDLGLTAVSAPASCWYGVGDVAVGLDHAAWWTDRLGTAGRPVARHDVAGVGHLVVATAWAEIVGTLLAPS